jgi:1,4-alpha-glucan branching enzyme/maltooligosyltrehalose trehalohydrolase
MDARSAGVHGHATDSTSLIGTHAHEMPFGAELRADGVRFRLWAPKLETLTLLLADATGEPERALPMDRGAAGWFECFVPGVGAGARYRYDVGGGLRVPDPASRFQPDDCHGPSEVIDPRAYRWRAGTWTGRPWHEAVVYELHVGTFTREGTFAAAIERLDALVELGATVLEVMPVADFPGARNWGYDGVLLYAPDSAYGRPEDFKNFVDAAHERGLAVLLDVVYNHFGPDGNYLHAYAPDFFTERHRTPWGAAVNYDGRGAGQDSRWVREFVIENALYWIQEYRLDGLRLDAVHAIADDSSPDVLEELAVRVQSGPGLDRDIHLVLENDANEARYLLPFGDTPPPYRAQWDDDVHHCWHVLATGESGGYYAAYADDPLGRLARCLASGFAYQGEVSSYSGEARGESTRGVPITSFLAFLQNHDQVGNRAFGERLAHVADEKRLRAVTAMLLLSPLPPLLFMGEEWAASTPFQYFCDFGPELATAVRNGRREEFSRFPEFADPAQRERIPDPVAESTFVRSKLDWSERDREPHAGWLAFYRRLLALRRAHVEPLLASGIAATRETRPSATELRIDWHAHDGRTLTLLANFDARPATFESPPGLMFWPEVAGELQAVVEPDAVQWYASSPEGRR